MTAPARQPRSNRAKPVRVTAAELLARLRKDRDPLVAAWAAKLAASKDAKT